MKTLLFPVTFALLTVPVVATAAPTLYSVRSNGDDRLYSIDAASGVATDLGQLAFDDAEGLGFAGNTLYAMGGSTNQLWNVTTSPGVLVGGTGFRLGTDAGLDYDSTTGRMYNANGASTGTGLYTIDLATGAATLVGSTSVFVDGLAIDAAGNAFGIDGIFTDSLYSVNLATGAATLLGGLGLGNISVQFGLTFADGVLYALSSAGALYTLNTSTGAAAFAANTTCGGQACDGWEGLAAPTVIAAVPEPGSLALLGIGLAGFGLARRRRTV